jgi:hypothetical protein
MSFSGQAMYKFNSKVRAAGSGIIRRECVSAVLGLKLKKNPTFEWSTSSVSPSKSRFVFNWWFGQWTWDGPVASRSLHSASYGFVS